MAYYICIYYIWHISLLYYAFIASKESIGLKVFDRMPVILILVDCIVGFFFVDGSRR